MKFWRTRAISGSSGRYLSSRGNQTERGTAPPLVKQALDLRHRDRASPVHA